MSWLRTDDGFTSHPKFSGWKAQEKWAFFELMHYCARYRTEGVIPTDLTLLPRGVNKRLLSLAERSGWVDRDPQNRMVIHDWSIYNPKDPTATSRKQRQRERDMNRDTDRDTNRDETVTRAQARAVPVPSRPVQEQNPPTNPPHLDHSASANGDTSDEPAAGRVALNEYGRTPEEQARIDAVDEWWDDKPLTRQTRDSEALVDISPLTPLNEIDAFPELKSDESLLAQLASERAREENQP